MRIILQALLPARDGTGWYALDEDAPLCTAGGCMRLAIAFHHGPDDDTGTVQDRFRCADHLDDNMSVRGGRVWVSNE